MKKAILFIFLISVLFNVENVTAKKVNNPENTTIQEKKETVSFSDLKNIVIGEQTKKGSASLKIDELTIVAGGADIWGTHDEFQYEYTTIKGDFDISVKVVSLSKTHLYTKAGLMARTDLTDNCKHVYFQVFPDNNARNKNNGGCEFQYRAEKAGEMKAIYPNQETAGNKFDVNFPNTWIRLKRTGNVYESFLSHNNKTWNLYSTYEQEMPDELMVGLAVTSHDAEEFTTAVFSGLQTTSKDK